MDPTDILESSLTKPKDAIFFCLSRALAEAFPDCTILETEDHLFYLDEFAHDGKCRLSPNDKAHQQMDVAWDNYHHVITGNPYTVWRNVIWEGHELQVVTTGVSFSMSREIRHFIICRQAQVADAFFEAVCAWCADVRGEILVFSNGCWSKSPDLFNSIRTTTLDDLVLPGNQAKDIVQGFRQFFDSKDTYDKYAVAWKRGVLFIGPPGNGKTHAVKGLVNELAKPCLYVRSFTAEYYPDEVNIASAFKRARQSAPCIFVLEDLDSLVNGSNRAFFLNELDGFYANTGILTVATSNHPERLDSSILDRPSRFDRKYTFDLPAVAERQTYLRKFSDKLDAGLQLSDGGVESVAAATDDFSYAYLKELFLSAMMRWIQDPGETPMDEIMVSQTEMLREQMKTAAELGEAFESSPDADEPPWKAMRRNMMRGFRSRM